MAHLLTSTILVLGILASVIGVTSNHSADSMATSLLLLGLGFLLLLFVLDRLCPSPSERSERSRRSGRGRNVRPGAWLKALPRRGWAGLALAALVVPVVYLQFHTGTTDAAQPQAPMAMPANQPTSPSLQAVLPHAVGNGSTLSLRTSVQLSAASVSDLPAPNPPASVSTPPSLPEELLADAVEAWRTSWAAKDVDRYLSAYAPTFAPADGRDLAGWKQWRRERLESAQTISIRIESLDMEPSPDGTGALTRFVQHYSAGPVRDTVLKTLHWRPSAQGWQIVREEAQAL